MLTNIYTSRNYRCKCCQPSDNWGGSWKGTLMPMCINEFLIKTKGSIIYKQVTQSITCTIIWSRNENEYWQQMNWKDPKFRTHLCLVDYQLNIKSIIKVEHIANAHIKYNFIHISNHANKLTIYWEHAKAGQECKHVILRKIITQKVQPNNIRPLSSFNKVENCVYV